MSGTGRFHIWEYHDCNLRRWYWLVTRVGRGRRHDY
jgi:hypothetical protein